MSTARRPLYEALIVVITAVWLFVVVRGVFDLSNVAGRNLALGNLSQLSTILTHIPRNAGYVLPVLLFVVSGFGIGDAILAALRLRPASRIARVAFALCLGQVAWLAVVVAIGMPGFLNAPVLYTMLVAGLGSSAWRIFVTRTQWTNGSVKQTAAAPRWLRAATIVAIVLLAFNLYLALLGALSPEVEFDGRFYHLAEAKRYADHGALFNLAASQDSSEVALPQNQEILYAAAIKLFGMPAGKILSWSNLLLSVVAILSFCVELFGSAEIGWLASLLFVSSPIVSWSGATANNDLSMAPYTLLAVCAVAVWSRRSGEWAWLAAAGILCGFTLGIKSFSVLTFGALVLAIVLLSLLPRWNGPQRSTAMRAAAIVVAVFTVATLIGGLPNFIREWITTGDPIYPIAGNITHSPFYWPKLELGIHSQLTAYGADTSWRALPVMPWVFTMYPEGYRDVIGPVFLFTFPFILAYCFLKKANALFRQLVLLLAMWTVFWFATQYIEARYALGMFPLVAILGSFLALSDETASLIGTVPQAFFLSVLCLLAVADCELIVPLQRGALAQQDFGSIKYNWPYLYRNLPERNVQLQYVPMVEYMNAHLNPRSDKVFVGTADILYGTYSDIDFYDGVVAPSEGYSPWNVLSTDAYQHLRENGIDYVLAPQSEETALQNSPLYQYLAFVTRAEPGEILYRVCAARCGHPPPSAGARIAAPGFYRYDNGAAVYKLSKDRTYCVVKNIDQMNAFGGFGQVQVVGPTVDFLQGYRATVPIGCAGP